MIRIIKANSQIFSGQSTFLRHKVNLVVNEENKKCPNIYWIPKLHQLASHER